MWRRRRRSRAYEGGRSFEGRVGGDLRLRMMLNEWQGRGEERRKEEGGLTFQGLMGRN